MILKSIIKGTAAAFFLLVVYFTILSLVSGWDFSQSQFFRFWYFIVGLAVGFGIQIGLFNWLKSAIKEKATGRVVAISGTTSTIVMISCCSHYLANILPIIGLSGFLALVGQYQIELFWLGLLANLAGIGYLSGKIVKFQKR